MLEMFLCKAFQNRIMLFICFDLKVPLYHGLGLQLVLKMDIIIIICIFD